MMILVHKSLGDDENNRKIVHPRSYQLSTHGNEYIPQKIKSDNFSRATSSPSGME